MLPHNDDAGGYECRNKSRHGGYGLSGKVFNHPRTVLTRTY